MNEQEYRAKRREEYLISAKKADEEALKTPDAYLRASWEKVADGYRELARSYECRIW